MSCVEEVINFVNESGDFDNFYFVFLENQSIKSFKIRLVFNLNKDNFTVISHENYLGITQNYGSYIALNIDQNLYMINSINASSVRATSLKYLKVLIE